MTGDDRGRARGVAGLMERLAGSAALLVVSRIGIPALVGVSIWGGNALIGIDRRVSAIELSRAAITEERSRRINALEMSDARDREAMSQLRSDMSSIAAQQAATLRALDRVERALERRDPR